MLCRLFPGGMLIKVPTVYAVYDSSEKEKLLLKYPERIQTYEDWEVLLEMLELKGSFHRSCEFFPEISPYVRKVSQR